MTPRVNFEPRYCKRGYSPLHVLYKHSSVKQYFKENRALRTETTINNPHDFGVNKGLPNWLYLRQLGTAINHRLLESERVSQDCLLSAESFDRLSQPTTTESGQRAPGLRFGQPRVMALFAALCRFAPGLNGFRHADVREIVSRLMGLAPDAYTASQMSYDLRRLRLKGLIARIAGTHTYILTTYGRQVAYLMTKLHRRIFDIASSALDPIPALPSPLPRLFRQLNEELDKLVTNAHLTPMKS